MEHAVVDCGGIAIGAGNPLVFIAGPCVIESEDHALRMAEQLMEIATRLRVPLIFKASYDKANRSSLASFRGPGLRAGLEILCKVRREIGVPVLSDVHQTHQMTHAAQVLDVIQIPAFLCRQTDLLVAAGATGKPVNIKKGQFMAPQDMRNAAEKVGGPVMLTERGASFGYNNLVVDFRSLPVMRATGWPVVFDATHSVQLPGSAGDSSGGQAEYIPTLARAAVAVGVDGVFMEVHDVPPLAKCDGRNALDLVLFENLVRQLVEIDRVVSSGC